MNHRVTIGLIALLVAAALLMLWALGSDPSPPSPLVIRAAAAPPLAPPPEPEPPADFEEPDAPPPRAAPRALHGVVSAADGDPIEDAHVEVERADGRAVEATTDGAGAYVTPPVGEVTRVTVTALGFEPHADDHPALPPGPRPRWDVTLDRARGVYGRVTSDDAPVSEGMAHLTGKVDGEFVIRETPLAPNGRYFIAWPDGDIEPPLHLTAFSALHGRAWEQVSEPGEQDFELPGGILIEGRVVDRAGAPVRQFLVTAGLLGRGGGSEAQHVEDAEGVFRIGPVWARYGTKVHVAAAGYRPVTIKVKGEPGEVVRGVEVVLDRSRAVTGQITDAVTGAPIGGARVAPSRLARRSFGDTLGALSGVDGRYRLETVPGDRVSLTVEADGYRALRVGPVHGDAETDQTRDVALTPEGDDPGATEETGAGLVLLPAFDPGPRSRLRIIQMADGGPGARALGPDDLIVAIDGEPAPSRLDFEMDALRDRLLGDVGTPIRLEVLRGGEGEPQTVTLTRERVRWPPVPAR